MRESHEKIYLNIYSNTSKARLQSMAVFDKISILGCEEARNRKCGHAKQFPSAEQE